jgi:3-deoxy-manno-octulosonate cytidylyltransferase (CMP-KDO synthetase)
MIPARYGSTRLPGKALREIAGKSMLHRVYERTSTADALSDVYIATDDGRIVEAVEAFGGRAIMTGADHLSGTDRLAEAAQAVDADIVVNVQGDQPFIDPVMIDEAVQPLLDDPALPMATLMHPIHTPEELADPGVVKTVVDRKGYALYFSRALIPAPHTDHPHQVYEHVGLYVYTKAFLLEWAALPPTVYEQVESLEQLRVLEHGYRMKVVETHCADTAYSGFSVDTEDDLARAEAMLRERGLE